MKCPSCGANIENDSKFCTNCGKNIDIAQQSEPTTVPTPQVSTQPTPVATYTNSGQPQPQKKKSNVALIIILVVVGFFVLTGIVLAVIIRMFIANVSNELENYNDDTVISDVVDDSSTGELYKTVKDPTGHEIKINKDGKLDGKDMYRVDVEYLFDKAYEMGNNAKKATTEEIDKLKATDSQKKATKSVISEFETFSTSSKYEIEEMLEKGNYSQEDIDFALKNSGIDWEEQTKIIILTYLSSGGISKNELVTFLIDDGYSEKEAEKAIENGSYDFYEQAVYDACFMKYISPKFGTTYSREQAQKLLEFDKYTTNEINFALKTIYDDMK